MAIPAEALELENRSIGKGGALTLGLAYELLRDQWRSGDRDRELGLHLMFLAWYLNVEDQELTGLDLARVQSDELTKVFNEVHDVILPAGTNTTDAEALYVVAIMVHIAPWILGDVKDWEERYEAYRVRYRQLLPDGIKPSQFADRGAYGNYFAGQAGVKGGV